MGHYDTSCGPMSCIPTRKDGVPEFVIKALYCRAVVFIVIPLVKLQVWSFHKWYCYATARQYRDLMMNSGMPVADLGGFQRFPLKPPLANSIIEIH